MAETDLISGVAEDGSPYHSGTGWGLPWGVAATGGVPRG